jgi:hypothetical protein
LVAAMWLQETRAKGPLRQQSFAISKARPLA